MFKRSINRDHAANGSGGGGGVAVVVDSQRQAVADGDREIVLRREEFTLRGKGWISFGQPRATVTVTVAQVETLGSTAHP